jgi:hypothetical protein
MCKINGDVSKVRVENVKSSGRIHQKQKQVPSGWGTDRGILVEGIPLRLKYINKTNCTCASADTTI